MTVAVYHKTIKNEFPEMKVRLEELNGTGVEVGVLKGEHAWLASIHEFGCTINVTPKQRAYLFKKGLKVGKTIKIPERAFLRGGFDENRDKVMQRAQQCVADVAAGKMTARGLHQAVGLMLSSKIKDYARDLSSPANHPFTVEQKGSSNPLVDTGDMIGGITWRKAK